MGLGRPPKMGPGFFPFFTSLLLFSLAILIFILGVKDSVEDGQEEAEKKNLLKPVYLIIALLGYPFVLNILGFLVTTFLLMLLMFSISEPKKLWVNIIASAIIVNASLLLFSKLLQVYLPSGKFRIGW
jgi:putative tricarboxylic transport membrane protein